jgi:hypothetical protein
MTDAHVWEVEMLWSRMGRLEKIKYLHSRGWSKSGSHWRHRRTGDVLPIRRAVRLELNKDLAAR